VTAAGSLLGALQRPAPCQLGAGLAHPGAALRKHEEKSIACSEEPDYASRGTYSFRQSDNRVLGSVSTLSLDGQDLHGLWVELGESSKLVHYGEPVRETLFPSVCWSSALSFAVPRERLIPLE
jgi:hypothetical protein